MRYIWVAVLVAVGLGLAVLVRISRKPADTQSIAKVKSIPKSQAKIKPLSVTQQALGRGRARAELSVDSGVDKPEEAEPPPRATIEDVPLVGQSTERIDAAFAAELKDPAWAERAERAFQADLERVAASGRFELVDLECRMAMCRSEVEWDSYAAAVVNWQSILHADYGLGCARRVDVPEPGANGEGEVDGPARGTAYFDCTEARAEELSR